MRFPALLIGLVVAATGTVFADEPVGFQEGMQLFTQYKCQRCHSVDKDMAGPSLRSIAKKYASDPHARDVLGTSILNGEIGKWDDSPVPMPPTKVQHSDLRPLVNWILSLNQY
ncbi:MAG TPA: c-type cytochrome [Steroidobacteraceae bacterium]|nr:c-type cytochrome [Steroidobacteraceae bacterium]